MPPPPLLRVEGLGVSYGALHALREVSWEVRAGEILGLIGPNGAGKSSCFEAATHMVARRGRVLLAGEDVSALPPWALAPRGLRRTFQQNAFFGDLSILENMSGMLLRTHGTPLVQAVFAPWRERARRRAAESAARGMLLGFAVPEELHLRPPADIPYGTQRMLSVALACTAGAKVLLLDEPAAGLGGADMTRLRDTLLRLRGEGLALVVIEHHMDLIMEIADRIQVLDQGAMLASGTPEEIRKDPRVLEAYLGRVA